MVFYNYFLEYFLLKSCNAEVVVEVHEMQMWIECADLRV